ncbi:DUF779 domain-containing protein [Azospirillum agricola]|uniref:DUF779 domain-containing protein n=1 Tax=Azospirillum agricola TaxID=1720247 RepID=UPI000A0F1943|nr:DUF779 domain-containing protein [Azospirillum agricola]SMH35409.1 hypothetical protein SAMN02982994_0864 [Azospirillum lipoferum]
MTDRVTATPEALALLDRLSARHGPLLLHLSGGCCDGTAPLCLPLGEFRMGGGDLCLGMVGGTPFCMADGTFAYWEHSQVILDVIQARGGGFSLEAPDGVRFTARARLFSDDELPHLLPPVPAGALAVPR